MSNTVFFGTIPEDKPVLHVTDYLVGFCSVVVHEFTGSKKDNAS